MNSLSFWLTRLAILTLFVFLSACLIIPLYMLLEGALRQHAAVRTALGILLLVWFLAIAQLAHITASRMVFGNMTFHAALKLGMAETRLAIGFLPVVGRWLGPRRSPSENDPIG